MISYDVEMTVSPRLLMSKRGPPGARLAAGPPPRPPEGLRRKQRELPSNGVADRGAAETAPRGGRCAGPEAARGGAPSSRESTLLTCKRSVL